MGHTRGTVLVGAFELQHGIAGPIAFEPIVGNGGAGNIAAQVFEFVALVGSAPRQTTGARWSPPSGSTRR